MVKSSQVDKCFHNPSTCTFACPYLYASQMAAKIILCGPDGTKPYRRHACCQNGMIDILEASTTLQLHAPAWPSCMQPQLTRLTIPEISRTLLEFYFIIIYFDNFCTCMAILLAASTDTFNHTRDL